MKTKRCTASKGCGLTKTIGCFVKSTKARQPHLCDPCYGKMTRAANMKSTKKKKADELAKANDRKPLDVAVNLMMSRAWV